MTKIKSTGNGFGVTLGTYENSQKIEWTSAKGTKVEVAVSYSINQKELSSHQEYGVSFAIDEWDTCFSRVITVTPKGGKTEKIIGGSKDALDDSNDKDGKFRSAGCVAKIAWMWLKKEDSDKIDALEAKVVSDLLAEANEYVEWKKIDDAKRAKNLADADKYYEDYDRTMNAMTANGGSY